ncbi:MAG: hypothetical protein GC189_12395 [Alphaproteobacteria bacterium]|nr:hypothetical protein [Alphaproteobacteria bacterium]
MTSFILFGLGYVLLLAGLVYAAVVLGVATQWIVAGALVLAGLGVMKTVSKTRHRDPVEPPASQ